jgi:hypothetical protein
MGLDYQAEDGSRSVSVVGVTVSTFGTIAARILRQQRRTSPPKDDPATAKLRADSYYSIIARAITQLPSNECETRQKLYDVRERRSLELETLRGSRVNDTPSNWPSAGLKKTRKCVRSSAKSLAIRRENNRSLIWCCGGFQLRAVVAAGH